MSSYSERKGRPIISEPHFTRSINVTSNTFYGTVKNKTDKDALVTAFTGILAPDGSNQFGNGFKFRPTVDGDVIVITIGDYQIAKSKGLLTDVAATDLATLTPFAQTIEACKAGIWEDQIVIAILTTSTVKILDVGI